MGEPPLAVERARALSLRPDAILAIVLVGG
jgi:hypothetical protein